MADKKDKTRYRNQAQRRNFYHYAKWKIVSSYKPSDNDLKQIFTYNLFWKAEKSILLYPKINQEDSMFDNYHRVPNEKKSNQCKLGFITILNKNGLRESSAIADEIFEKFEINKIFNHL